jgi:hypothetical protein
MTLEFTAQERQLFAVIAEEAKRLNQEVYAIGGFIRDKLLGIPSKDIDFVTVGDGPALAERVNAALGNPPSALSIFKNFGTAMFRYHDIELEFVGARKESYRAESRKPDVEQGTLHEDQLRRDFTINALAIDLLSGSEYTVIDPFNGLADLGAKRIVTPLDPHQTFSDDPLRMLRAIRFASQLSFIIDEITFKAISEMASRIQIVSMERITKDAMVEALEEHLPQLSWTNPNGGFYVWVTMPDVLDSKQMLPRAVRELVAYTPGTAFFADGRGRHAMRLSFCYPTPDAIRLGIRRLATVVNGELDLLDTFAGTGTLRLPPSPGYDSAPPSDLK